MGMERVTKALAAATGAVVGLYGGWTQGSRVLVAMMVMDYVLGCLVAFRGRSPKTETGRFLSEVAFGGLLKKASILAVLLLAVLLDRAIGSGQGVMFRSTVEFFYIATEGLSVVENAGLLGAPVPAPLRRALEALKEESEREPEEKPEEKKEQDEE